MSEEKKQLTEVELDEVAGGDVIGNTLQSVAKGAAAGVNLIGNALATLPPTDSSHAPKNWEY